MFPARIKCNLKSLTMEQIEEHVCYIQMYSQATHLEMLYVPTQANVLSLSIYSIGYSNGIFCICFTTLVDLQADRYLVYE